jgi:hypothetical protein
MIEIKAFSHSGIWFNAAGSPSGTKTVIHAHAAHYIVSDLKKCPCGKKSSQDRDLSMR